MSRAGAPLRSAPELPPRWSLDDRADAVAEDDQPLVSFGLNSDRLFFITWHESQGAGLPRAPRVGLGVSEEAPPFIFVFAEDTAAE